MNIQQASIYSGKSESTLRRLIHKGKLPAPLIEGKYEIAMSALDALTVQPTPDTLSARITELERQVSALQGIVREMSSNPPIRRLAPPRATYAASRPSENDPLPEGLTPINDLIKEYHLPRSTVIHNMRPYLKEGNWKAGGSVIHHALDAEGVVEFKRHYER